MAEQELQKRIENAELLMTTVTTWIANIDTKISYAITLASALLGFVLSKGRPIAFVEFETASTRSFVLFFRVSIVSLLYIASLSTIIMFLLAIQCRIKPSTGNTSLLFFGTIQSLTLDSYISQFNKLSEDDYSRQLLEQVHTNSVICTKKSNWYNRGILLLGIALSLYLVCLSFGYL